MRPSVPRLAAAVVAAAAIGLLSACWQSERGQDKALVLYRGNTAEPISLDPAKASGSWENAILADMFIGLFTDDAAGKPVPGMAQRWTVSEDQLAWTFTLRDALWSDGEP